MRKFACAVSGALLCGALFGQSSDSAPRFDMARAQPSAKTATQFMRVAPVRNGRYEIRTATMLDLIRLAWTFQADRILGGPPWLELDHFDITAKVPAETAPDTQHLMLQSLLKERFQLTLHRDMRPVPAWVLTTGKKPLLKEADGSGETGCKLQTGSGPPPEGGSRIIFGDANGTRTPVILGPGMTLHYSCRNMTMTAFASGLGGMRGVQLPMPVLDETGLKGLWNFDIRWSLPFLGPMGTSGDRITLA